MTPARGLAEERRGTGVPLAGVLAAGALWGWGAAAGLVGWDFNTLEPTSNSAPRVTAGAITRANGGTSALLSGQSPSGNYAAASGLTNLQAAARAGALSTNDATYFEVTLTPEAGYRVNVTNLSFGTRSTATGPTAYCVRADTDGYAANLSLGTLAADDDWAWKQQSVTFCSAAAGEAVKLRLYGYGGSGASAGNWRIDDLALDVCAVEAGTPFPPAVGWIEPQSVRVGASLTFALTIRPTDGDPVTGTNVTASSGVTGAWGLASGLFSYTPEPGDEGERWFAFTAWDKDGTSSPVTVSVTVLRAQVPTVRMTTRTGTYTQGFDALATNGADNVWDDAAWPLPVWYACLGSVPARFYKAGKGAETTGALYSYGSEGSADRAWGALASGTTGDIRYGVAFTNETGGTVTNLTVTYAGEQWRCASNTVQSLCFGYCVTNAVVPLAQGVFSWMPALRFDAPRTLDMKAGAVTGEGYTVTADVPVTVQPGEVVLLCWEDKDDEGLDHGLALDDLTVSWSADRTASARRASVMSLK